MKLSALLPALILAATGVAAQTHQHGSMPAGDGSFNPFVVSDNRGGFYLGFIQRSNRASNVSTDRGAEIWLSTSEDRGKTFSRDRRILSDVCECCRTNIQIDSAGRLFLSYRTVPRKGAMYRDIVVARSTDAGISFKTTTVSADGWDINACPVTGPALCLDSRDQVHVVWFTGGGEKPGLYYTTSGDHGTSYSPRKPLDPDQKLGKHAQAISQPDGKILVTWDDQLEGPVTFFGILDQITGLKRRRLAHEHLSYPTLAANKTVAIIAGLAGSNEVLIITEPIADEASTQKQ